MMTGMDNVANDFYEDDEPIEKITAAFERGVKGVTAPPSRGRTEYLDAYWHIADTSNETCGEFVAH
jgi:hypothetical protein